METTYLSAMLLGLLHGLEPGHGWPAAALFALGRRRAYATGLRAAAVLSFFHFLSSVAVAGAFLLLSWKLELHTLEAARYLAALVLFIMAYRAFREGGGARGGRGARPIGSLKEMALFAYFLGFIHEEEVAILALCLANVNCLLLMAAYALVVSGALIGVTLLAIAGYSRLEAPLERWRPYLPKATGSLLALLGVLYIMRAI
ncbi:MAG: hypothetical protein ACE5JJ_08435 [Nitrospinota bacterium]